MTSGGFVEDRFQRALAYEFRREQALDGIRGMAAQLRPGATMQVEAHSPDPLKEPVYHDGRLFTATIDTPL